MFSKKDEITNIPNTIFKFFVYFIGKNSISFLVLALTSLVWAINQNVFPYFIKIVVNTVYMSKNDVSLMGNLHGPLMLLCGELLFMLLSMRIQGLLITKIMPKFSESIKNEIIHTISTYHMNYYIKNQSGVITSKLLNLASSSEKIIQILLFNFLSTISSLIISIMLISAVSKPVSVIILTWSALHMAISILFIKRFQEKLNQTATSSSTTSNMVNDFVSNIINIITFSNEKNELTRLQSTFKNEKVCFKKILTSLEMMKLSLAFLGTIFILGIVFFMIHLIGEKLITAGDFAMILMLSFTMLTFIWQLSFHIGNFVRELSVVKSSILILNKNFQNNIETSKNEIKIHGGKIEFINVSCSYNENKEIFKDLSMTINPGEKIRIKGESGCGKTTLINLLVRLIDLNKGDILVDGQSIYKISSESLRLNIAFVSQEPILFHRTIFENIQFGNMICTDDEVYQAAKTACCHDFILELSDGYNSRVGEGSIKLSGGQRQRILIARAVLKNSPILILDEPTSSLDENTENEIYKNIFSKNTKQTIILISHNERANNYMDKIWVIESGSHKKIIDSVTEMKIPVYIQQPINEANMGVVNA
ncbi:MAG: ABC transporter ATP-binding protein [Coxiellaceae bacterium]|nr:ABC transporter ATP-binding protein [Coxiellaceae bacterium]